MPDQLKTPIQMLSFFCLLAIILLISNRVFQPDTRSVAPEQSGPTVSVPPTLMVNGVEMPTGASPQAANSHLEISKIVDKTAAPNGGLVEFTVTIRNIHPTEAVPNLVFIENPAPVISILGTPTFSAGVQPFGGPNEKAWIFDNPLVAGNSVTIVITAQLLASSSCDILAANEAAAVGTNAALISTKATVLVQIRPCVFLPLVQKAPTPTPPPIATVGPVYYFDNFSDNDSGWPDDIYNDSDRCYSEYKDQEYRMRVEGDGSRRECFRPAPSDAEHKRALFEVQVRRTGGGGSFNYGLYANGRGGSEYYLFRVRPGDSCGWELIRRENSDSDTALSGGCDSAINRYSETNRLALRHDNNDKISVYINGKRLGIFDDDDPLTEGQGTGVYVRTGNDDDNTIHFDNFTVSSPDAEPNN